AASRTFCTAGSSRPISTAMMAITTSSSMSVNARRRGSGFGNMIDLSSMKQLRLAAAESAPKRKANRGNLEGEEDRCGYNSRSKRPCKRKNEQEVKIPGRGSASRQQFDRGEGGHGLAAEHDRHLLTGVGDYVTVQISSALNRSSTFARPFLAI